MSSRMSFRVAVVFLAVAISLLTVPSVMAGTDKPYDSLSPAGESTTSSVASQRLAAPSPAVAALSPIERTMANTHTVTGLYDEPSASSAAISWIMPGVAVRILGSSANLAYYAIATSEQSTDVSGWVAAGDVDYRPVVETATRLTMVYQQRDASSEVIGMLAPGQSAGLIGISPDGKWAALTNPGAGRSAGWVAASDLQRDYAVGQTNGLTKTHLRADGGSPLYEVLSPAVAVMMVGRSADSAWIALMTKNGRRFLGWARPAEVQHRMNLATLPIMAR